MRTSGSTDFLLNRNEIIERALRASGIRGVGITPSADDISICGDAFNMMLSDWQAQRINVAHVKDIVVFPRYGVAEYPLGPYGFDAAEFYFQAELSEDVAAGVATFPVASNQADADSICLSQSVLSATTLVLNGLYSSGGKASLPVSRKIYIQSSTGESDVVFSVVGKTANGVSATEDITVSSGAGTSYSGTNTYKSIDSITASALCAGSITVGSYGISAGDYLLVELDDGTVHRDVVQQSLSISIYGKSVLPSAASDGNAIFVYPSKIVRPTEILSARSYSLTGQETPLSRYESKSDYLRLAMGKTDVGTPTSYFYDPGVDTGMLYLYPTPSDVTTVIKCQARMPVEDLDSSAQNAYFPKEWTTALVMNLAVSICLYFNKDPSPFLLKQAQDALKNCRRFENQNRSIKFIPHISR